MSEVSGSEKGTRLRLSEVPSLLKETILSFLDESGLHHGAALAYYALFAIVPLLYLSITYFGRIIGYDVMADIIADVLRNKVGIKDVSGIMDFMDQLDFEKGNFFLESVSIIALLIACSAFLVCLKNTINVFYDLEVNFTSKRRKIIKNVIFRLISIASVGAFTVVIVALYFAQTVVLSMGNSILDEREVLNQVFLSVARHGFSLLTNVLIFTIVFKFVHDGFVTWKLAIGGAVLTSVLLYLGQLLIKYYLYHYFFAASVGLAGSFFIILAWVYYSSQIIFFGAKFTSVYARRIGKPIHFRE